MPEARFLDHWFCIMRIMLSKTVPVLFLLVAGVAEALFPNAASAASCEALVGKWMWFIGGEVTVNPDGTFTQQSGNTGTWECTDTARGAVTLRWRQGGFVNRMLLSPDGQGLSSLDPSQMYVTAKRIGASSEAKQIPQESKQAPQASPSNDTQEIARLVQRMSSNYQDTLLFDGDSDGAYIQKGVGIELSRDYGGKATLQQNFHICDLTSGMDPKNYKASIDTVNDCDKNRQGLMWEQNLFQTAPLTQIEPLSIKVSQLDRRSRWSALNYVKHEGLHVTFDFAGYKARSGTITSIVCKSRDACQQMAADLKVLVTLVQKSTAPKSTSSLQSAPRTGEESRSTVSNISQEVTQLMERFKQNYSRTALEFYRPGHGFSDGSIRKGHAVALEQGFTLVERYIECDISDPFWRFSKDGPTPDPWPAGYRMSVDSVTDCDKQRYGLNWKETTVRRPLAEIDPSSIKLSKTDIWGEETALHISFDAYPANMTEFEKEYASPVVGVSCKDRNACEQIVADLKRLVEIARKFTATNKAVTR